MDIILTKDVTNIKEVLLKLWDETVSDEEEGKQHLVEAGIKGSLDKDIYLEIKKNNVLAGIIHYELLEEGVYDPHMNMLPEYRKEFAKEAALRTMELVHNLTKCKLYRIFVPTCYPNVQKFAESVGFKKVGIAPDKWIKSGKSYDIDVSEVELTKWVRLEN